MIMKYSVIMKTARKEPHFEPFFAVVDALFIRVFILYLIIKNIKYNLINLGFYANILV